MIYLFQNITDYDYDVRALALAFFEREKIHALTEEEFDALVSKASMEKADQNKPEIFIRLFFGENVIQGSIFSVPFTKTAIKTDERQDVFGTQSRIEDTLQGDYHDRVAFRNEFCRFLYGLLSNYCGRKLPWGTLTGIRPSKIMMKWMEEENDPEILEKRFEEVYLADRQKASLCRKVALKEKQLLSKREFQNEYSLYIGIPFCPTTCLYCSFTSFPVARFGERIPAYLEALIKELRYVSESMSQKRLSTIYIGGGTPTALDEYSLKYLLEAVHKYFSVNQALEFTVEAGRPDSLSKGKLQAILDAGVERISINPQTMHQSTLDLIGRAHTVEQTIEGFKSAREIGFHNINMDMITGLPGEDLQYVEHTLDEIFKLKPESLTVHSLAIKRAAHLNIEMERYRSLVKGSTNEMLKLTDEYCGRMGMEPYYMYRQKNIPGNLENIGYSIPGKECFYNMLIMEEKQDIVACGAGASTKFVYPGNRIERTENVKNIDHYINRIDEMIERKKRLRAQ